MNFECEYCGKTFQRTARAYRRSLKTGQAIKYCSRECANHGRDTRVEKICPVCGKTFLVQKRLSSQNLSCSSECAKIRSQQVNELVPLTCEQCGKEFSVTRSYLTKQLKRNQPVKFCSNECRFKHIQANTVETECPVCGKIFRNSTDENVKKKLVVLSNVAIHLETNYIA